MTSDLHLGRLPERDYRDQRFLAREALRADEQALPTEGYRYWWDNGAWLDQGNTGTCVGYSAACWLEDSPVTHPGWDPDPIRLYKEACLRDEWPENDGGDLQFGTSIHAIAKVLKDAGVLSTYLWATDLTTVLRWLLYRGPILAGTTWWNSMFTPTEGKDALGDDRMLVNIDEDSGLAGGHAYLWNGVNIERRLIRVKLGSWPRDSFGVNGRASITFETAEQLIWNWGELMMSDEIVGMAENYVSTTDRMP